MPVCDRAQVVRRDEDLARRKRDTASTLGLFKSLPERTEEPLVRLFENLRFVKNQHCGIRVVGQGGVYWLNYRHETESAGKEFAIVGEHELLVEIFFKPIVAPALSRTAAPVAKHFAADH